MVAAQIPPAAATWLRPGEMKMWANVHSSGDALRKPPPCARVHTCDAAGGGACDASAAAPFYAQPSPSAAQLPEARLRGLRVFFLEGHVGPMNDMLATLHDGLGMNTSGPEGMVFMQGMINRNQIDQRFFKCRLCRLGHNRSRELASWLIESKKPGARMFTLPDCEQKRCRAALFDDALRREFAARFGRDIEANYDAVACNFPTWQCALFMHVNVAILMRFTHRYDHHAQGLSLQPFMREGEGPQNHLLSSRLGPRGMTPSLTVAEEAVHVLKRMAQMPNVVFAASNAYDHVYLRRNLGVDAVPWPGLASQLARVRYTGGDPSGRREVLFCCGAQAYNKPIYAWAGRIVEESNRIAARAFERAASTVDGTPRATNRTFAWISNLYPKGWQCKNVPKRTQAPGGLANASLEQGGGGRRLDAGKGRRSVVRSKGKRGGGRSVRSKPETIVQCGYRYEDVASHPLVLLLPYSVHSYGLVNAYSMGIPVVAPSLRLLAALHSATGIVSHKGPSNVPWRSTPEQPIRTWLSRDGKAWHVPGPATPTSPCCRDDPNDACTPKAAQAWLQFADWYQWPHIRYYDAPEDLMATIDELLANATLRRQISAAQKAYFAAELQRAKRHVSTSLRRATDHVTLMEAKKKSSSSV